MSKARAVSPWPPNHNAVTPPATTASASKKFQFVTAIPSSDAERSQNKVLVRSNASNYHWRRVKKDADVPSPRPVAKRRSSAPIHTIKSSKRALAPALPRNADATARSETATPKSEEAEVELVNRSPASEGDLLSFSPASFSTWIVSGHHDPFETYPSDLSREVVSPVLDQGTLVLLVRITTLS
jgi:hypothetical protein